MEKILIAALNALVKQGKMAPPKLVAAMKAHGIKNSKQDPTTI